MQTGCSAASAAVTACYAPEVKDVAARFAGLRHRNPPQTGRRFTRLPSEPMQKGREEYVNVMISDTCFEAPLNRTAILHSYGYLD
jgi:hypothetical protein